MLLLRVVRSLGKREAPAIKRKTHCLYNKPEERREMSEDSDEECVLSDEEEEEDRIVKKTNNDEILDPFTLQPSTLPNHSYVMNITEMKSIFINKGR